MIYQCFFRDDQRERLFLTSAYAPLGIEPAVNDQLCVNCPELGSEAVRLQLTEYGGFLFMWRNMQINPHDWIGFTSWRQLDKSDVVFESAEAVAAALADVDYVAWAPWDVSRVQHGWLRGTAAHSEISHPHLHSFIVEMFRETNEAMPRAYSHASVVPYANYWAMSNTLFDEYMRWSWPLVQRALVSKHIYVNYVPPWDHKGDVRKTIGYFMERLFIIWTMRRELRPRFLGVVKRPDYV